LIYSPTAKIHGIIRKKRIRSEITHHTFLTLFDFLVEDLGALGVIIVDLYEFLQLMKVKEIIAFFLFNH